MKFSKLLFIALMSVVMAHPSHAQTTDVWQGKGRIAISSDGNKHDNDDMQATMMTLMILAKAGLQNNTVLYTYADHIWGSEDNDLAIMRESAEGGGERFGFQATRFMAAVTDPEAAYNAMRDEIAKSTADNPLFIIAAGPMQVVGEGLDRASVVNPAALNHVTIISHSNWNDRHADNPETGGVHGDEPTHSGWTWDEMVAAHGNKVNFNHISDQNGTGDQPYKSKDKFSAPSWDDWAWMGNHQDPNVQWVYTKGKSNPGGPDYSDAGMAYYLCADLNEQRGDEFGNPVKLKEWIGPDVIPVVIDPTKVSSVSLHTNAYHIKNIGDTYQLTATVSPATAVNKNLSWVSSNPEVATVSATGLVTGLKLGNASIIATTEDGAKTATASIQVGVVEAGDYNVGDDFISFEAESTKSPLSKWKLRQPGWAEYIEGSSGVKPINNTYLEYTGGTEDGNAAGQDILVYKFTPKTSGVYQLTGRMAQNQNGAAWDKCNDIYVKMEGDFEAVSGGATKAELSNWAKFYGRGLEDWGCFVKGEPTHGHKAEMKYQLTAGVEYTFSVSGRAQRTCVDYYLFFKQGAAVTIAEKLDLATHSPTYMRPNGVAVEPGPDPEPVCQTIQAWDFDQVAVDGFDSATKGTIPASPADGINTGAQVIGCAGTNGLTRAIAAEETYTGSDAEVTFVVKAVGEPDGECTYAVYVNGTKIGEKTSTRIYGTDTPPYTYEDLQINTTPVALKNGDVIRVTSNQVSNNLVPEGDGFATARGRWQSVSLCGDEISQPVTETVTFVDLPEAISTDLLAIPFKVKYTAGESRDINVAIKTPDDVFVKNNQVNVPAGTGEKIITVTVDAPLAVADGYKLNVALRPVGGNWQTNISNQDATLNVVDEVVQEPAGKDTVSFIDVPMKLQSQTSYTLSVAYEASTQREIRVEFWGDAWLGATVLTVEKGVGTADISVNLPTASAAGTNYMWKTNIRPVGASWEENIVNEEVGGVEVVEHVAVEGITVDQTNVVFDMVGTTQQLHATLSPAAATNKQILWSTSNADVVTVSSTGLLTAVANGGATVTATAADGGFTAETAVSVNMLLTITHPLTAVQDAYLQNGTRFNTNDLRVETGRRTAYLQFDLSGVSGEIESATLRLAVGSDAGNGQLEFALGSSNTWTENNLSDTNAPTAEALLANGSGAYEVGETYTWTLDETQLNGGGLLSIVIKQVSGNDISFASSENTLETLRPSLIVVAKGTKKAEDAVIDKSSKALVYPNPFVDELNVRLGSSHNFNAIRVLDLSGQVIYSSRLSQQTKIELGNSPLGTAKKGMYFIHLLGDSERELIKVIKN